MRFPLCNNSTVENVTNVVIFISDSLRFDALPAQVSDLGVTFRGIAASTSTKSSLPSITSGKYPDNHNVWSFNGKLSSKPELLRHPNSGFNAETIWTHLNPETKPPLRMNHVKERTTLGDLESPFVYVEHDKGGHSPYGKSFSEFPSSEDFFNHYSEDIPRIIDLYHEGVEQSFERFRSLYDEVRSKGELKETLLIFTSDHGELLGEKEYGGIWDHGSPMVPELVYVPVVFIGAGLPQGVTGDEFVSGTDIAPTALGAMERTIPSDVDGTNLWSSSFQASPHYQSEYWFKGHEVTVRGSKRHVGGYQAVSLWNPDGGIVVHNNSPVQRFLNCHYTNLHGAAYSSVTKSNLRPATYFSMVNTYVRKKTTYGAPLLENDIIDALGEITFKDREELDKGLDEITREQLERLGYLE